MAVLMLGMLFGLVLIPVLLSTHLTRKNRKLEETSRKFDEYRRSTRHMLEAKYFVVCNQQTVEAKRKVEPDFPCPKCVLPWDQPNWWEKEEICWTAHLMMFDKNMENLYLLLGAMLQYKKQKCANPTYNKDGINEKCLKATLHARSRIDHFLKTMIKAHGGPRIDRGWNKEN